MYTKIGTYYSFQMTVRCPDCHLKRIISTNCCIHTVVPPDDGPRCARNMQRLTKYTNYKLCFKLGFLYTLISRYTVNKTYKKIYRVSQEECARLREGVPYVKVHQYNPKHLCPKLNRYGDNGQRKVWSSGRSTHCTCQLTNLSMSVFECGVILWQFSSRSL